jgi:hypothetical protein
MADDKKLEEWKWAAVFIEVALRAVRRVHYEYGLWGIGPQWQMDRQLAKRINFGQGIELALETAVCAAITQEFMQSPSLAGVWVERGPDGKPDHERRYFMIDREAKYLTGDKKRVDLFVQKFTPKEDHSPTELERVRLPSFIEAKRARLWTADIKTGEAQHQKRQISDVQNDVQKLKVEIEYRKKNCRENDHMRGHVLVWGVHGEGQHQDEPAEFFKDVGGVELHTLRWLPLQCSQPSRDNLIEGKLSMPKLQAALWIGLAEVLG